MIVVGIDPHMKTHTAAALDAATGRNLGTKTVTSDGPGHDELLAWVRGLGPDRFFAVEDCRHVSGGLERHLLPRGERVVRVPPKMMAGARSSARTYGKSDPIDAACVARAGRDVSASSSDWRRGRLCSSRTASIAPHVWTRSPTGRTCYLPARMNGTRRAG